MGISAEEVSLYRELFSAKALPFRITAYLSGSDPELERLLSEKPLRGFAEDHFSIVGVKFLADGSLGARSAALLSDYSDDPGNRGILLMDAEDLHREMLRCQKKGFQIAVHAIGDAAVREALDIYERILSEHPSCDMRHRIEHAQVIPPQDIPRFAALGVIPSMQFTHCTSDMPWAQARLGPERIKGAYAWRSLIRAGSRIPGGSDFPVESIRPLLGIYAAVTRRDVAGTPEVGWMSEQCLTVEEAVRAFTIDAAYAAHAEHEAGTLTPGKLADCIVISDDIFSVKSAEIPKIEILATILGGEIVHRSDAF
jgi:predicted amidohydrolase YtcJ